MIRNGNTFVDVPEAQQHYFKSVLVSHTASKEPVLNSISLFVLFHARSCPRQLAKVPHRRGYESNISDMPKDADLFKVQLQDGDLILCFVRRP